MHSITGNLSNVHLILLPPNTTPFTQSMDQEVLKCSKAHYQRHLVRLMIQHLDQGQDLPKISIRFAPQLLQASWNDVTKTTVINCFWKARIFRENQIDAVADNDDPFKDLQEDLFELRQYNLELDFEELTAEDVANTDSNVLTTDTPTIDTETLESANLEKENEIDKYDGIKIFDEFGVKPNSI